MLADNSRKVEETVAPLEKEEKILKNLEKYYTNETS